MFFFYFPKNLAPIPGPLQPCLYSSIETWVGLLKKSNSRTKKSINIVAHFLTLNLFFHFFFKTNFRETLISRKKIFQSENVPKIPAPSIENRNHQLHFKSPFRPALVLREKCLLTRRKSFDRNSEKKMFPLRSALAARGLMSGSMIGGARCRSMSDMAFTFAAPNAVLYNAAAVKQVDVPSFSGSFGILPSHVPSLAVLKPGKKIKKLKVIILSFSS